MVQCSTVIARQHAWYCTARYCNSTVCPMPVLCLNICIYRQTLPTFLYGYHSSFAYTTLLLRNSNGKALRWTLENFTICGLNTLDSDSALEYPYSSSQPD